MQKISQTVSFGKIGIHQFEILSCVSSGKTSRLGRFSFRRQWLAGNYSVKILVYALSRVSSIQLSISNTAYDEADMVFINRVSFMDTHVST